MKILPLKTVSVFVAFVVVGTSARAEEADSAQQLTDIMNIVSGIAREAAPLAKQEFPLLVQ
jgi:hypothetical protein